MPGHGSKKQSQRTKGNAKVTVTCQSRCSKIISQVNEHMVQTNHKKMISPIKIFVKLEFFI